MASFKNQLLQIGIAGVAGALLVGVSAWYSDNVGSQALDLSQRIAAARSNFIEADMMHDALRGDVLKAMLTGAELQLSPTDEQRQKLNAQGAETKTEVQEHAQRFRDLLQANEQLDLAPQLKQAMQQLKPALENYITQANQAVEGALLNYTQQQQKMPEFYQAFGDLEQRNEQYAELLEKYALEEIAAMEASTELARYLEVIAFAFAAVAAFGLALRTANRVMAQLGGEPVVVTKVAQAIASGRYDMALDSDVATDSLLGQLDVARRTLLKNQQEAAAAEALRQQMDADKARLMTESLRIRDALNNLDVCVMIADVHHKVVFLNPALQNLFRTSANELRQDLPQFDAEHILGSSMDIFHKQPHHQQQLLANLQTTHVANIKVGGRSFRLKASPVFNDQQQRIGTVVEWLDRTLEIQAEEEVARVIQATAQGDFSYQISEQGKAGFMLQVAQGVNQMTSLAGRSLNDISKVLQAIADGDLTQRVSGSYAGLFEELKQACHQTADRLGEMLGDIQTSALTIQQASSEISQGNQDLSSRTEQQASSLEQTAASMDELTQTVRMNAENAKVAYQLTENTREIAEKGGNLLNETMRTMAGINQSAEKIADIISLIDGIAFQTNILALNAAVEAARAGEQGRGFAVVAGEVRSLAQRAANAAKDIKELISASVEQIGHGNTQVLESGETMQNIVDAVRKVNGLMSDIANASNEQAVGLSEVSKAVASMDTMTQQNAALVEEATSAAVSLSSQADMLNEKVATFKLSGQAQLMPPPRQALPAGYKALPSSNSRPTRGLPNRRG